MTPRSHGIRSDPAATPWHSSLATRHSPLVTSRAAFTLIELLTVIAVILILAAMVTAGVWSAFKKAKIQKACQEVRALESAILQYYHTYSRLPLGKQSDHDWQPFESNDKSIRTDPARLKNIIAILRGDDAPNDMPPGQNPKKIVFLDLDPASDGGPDREILEDPWGNVYEFYFDMNYDGNVTALYSVALTGGWTTIPGVRVIVYCLGPNGQEEVSYREQSDDICSRISGTGYRNG